MDNTNTFLEDLLRRRESKTLEFKLNCNSLPKILQTVVAFANTAGGNIVIGVDDKTRDVVGLKDVLKDEERLANAIADSIAPLILPLIEVYSFRKKEVIVVKVPCGLGPFYLKSQGPEHGVCVRLGSTNRVADQLTLDELVRVSKRISFDELPCTRCGPDDVDWDGITKLFKTHAKKRMSQQKKHDLGLMVGHLGDAYPSNAAMILVGKNRGGLPFPDAMIRCARFKGLSKAKFLDHQDLEEDLFTSLEIAEAFVARHTTLEARIESVRRVDIPEYPPTAIREALLNAILHADYAMTGCTITLAIFDNRIEITNPGALPYGMTLELATHGASRLRNKIIGNVLKELGFVEQWGSGIKRIISVYEEEDLQPPIFEELGNQFRVTLFSRYHQPTELQDWIKDLVTYLQKSKSIQH